MSDVVGVIPPGCASHGGRGDAYRHTYSSPLPLPPSLRHAPPVRFQVTQCLKAYEKVKKKAENAKYAWLQAREHAAALHGQHDRARKRVIDTGGMCRARGRKALGFDF